MKSRLIRLALVLALAASTSGCYVDVRRFDAARVRDDIAADARLRSDRAAIVDRVVWVPSDRPDDCGASALASALANAGIRRDVEDVRAWIVDPARGGAPTSALVRYAREAGAFALCRERWWLDDLKLWVRHGVAPVLLIAAGDLAPGRYHYVMLKGFDDGLRYALLIDQTREDLVMEYDVLFDRWCQARGWALVVSPPSIDIGDDAIGLDAKELGALGWLAETQGALAAAQKDYRAALARDPSFAAAKQNLANVEAALHSNRSP